MTQPELVRAMEFIMPGCFVWRDIFLFETSFIFHCPHCGDEMVIRFGDNMLHDLDEMSLAAFVHNEIYEMHKLHEKRRQSNDRSCILS